MAKTEKTYTKKNLQVSIRLRDLLTVEVDTIDRVVALTVIAALTLLTTLYLYF
jgi:hypothetical protein